ncbi:hypothetical protein FRC14_006592 [Serendipita sp. 396]|nr:hypothetical protein FRC14_006592 [Serendipita sp. 396]KAG8779288.1 hypothetical protein FRC15_010266 [Serendipita sp. 397]KAG8796367.1 hypothetical protein FRC16_009724 [Serendipita sp. 398]KAG8864665.1 hypothetical protein FRC20_010179 [Serendipita sp. 405]
MPSKVSQHFLGLQLSVDSLRAAIVDEQLELVGSEHVDFDSEFPEYQTRAGVHVSPGDVYMTSVEIWLRALDILFERLQRNYELAKIKAISGAAQLCPVWLTSDVVSALQSVSPQASLREQLMQTVFSVPQVPVAHDNSAAQFASSLEAALGGPEAMANQVGVTAHASLLAAQMLHLRTANADAWKQTSHVTLASGFLCSVLTGKLACFRESEASATGMYALSKEQWDENVLQAIAGPGDSIQRLKSMLGNVERNAAAPIGTVHPYFSSKYGLESDVSIYPFTSECLASYLSLAPSSADCVVEFGTTDILLTPAAKVVPSPYFITVPHPAQDTTAEKRKYISMIMTRNADVPRALVRDAYTKSWSAFDRLVAVVPPGGSIGLDDKLFSFWLLQEEQYPFSHVKGVYRFETGVKVAEFRDLRANPRCLLESQILSIRVRLAHLNNNGVFLPSRSLKSPRSSQVVDGIGVKFDPYDIANLPKRILATGSACTFPSVVGLLGDIFNAPVLVPNSLVEQSTPEASRLPSTARPALGAAYVARWGWRKTSRPDEKHASFEDEVRWLMTKKWTVAGNGPATSGGNRSRSVSAPGTAPGPGYKHLHAKSGLAASSFAEEDEDEENNEASFGQYSGAVTPPRSLKNLTATPALSSAATTPSLSSISGSSANPTPNIPLEVGLENAAGSGYPPLAPIQPLPTDDADIQLGLVKVAEADHDTFLTYAAIVPEYCRLERMIVKGLV